MIVSFKLRGCKRTEKQFRDGVNIYGLVNPKCFSYTRLYRIKSIRLHSRVKLRQKNAILVWNKVKFQKLLSEQGICFLVAEV